MVGFSKSESPTIRRRRLVNPPFLRSQLPANSIHSLEGTPKERYFTSWTICPRIVRQSINFFSTRNPKLYGCVLINGHLPNSFSNEANPKLLFPLSIYIYWLIVRNHVYLSVHNLSLHTHNGPKNSLRFFSLFLYYYWHRTRKFMIA